MPRKPLALTMAALAVATLALQAPPPSDPELEAAIQQVQQGDFDAAIPALDAVARRLAASGGKAKLLSRAYLYLSIAYLGLSQEQKAKAQFLEAWKADQGMELTAKEFPPKVLHFFEEARKEAAARGVTPSSPPSTKPAASPPPTPEAPVDVIEQRSARQSPSKGRSKALPVLLGVAGAAAIAVAVAGGGGGSAAPTATPTPTPTATPTPATTGGSGSITFLGSTPPPGSTVSVSTSGALQMRFSVTFSRAISDAQLYVYFPSRDDFCVFADSTRGPVAAGTTTMTAPRPNSTLGYKPACLPVTITTAEAYLFDLHSGSFSETLVTQPLSLTYTFFNPLVP